VAVEAAFAGWTVLEVMGGAVGVICMAIGQWASWSNGKTLTLTGFAALVATLISMSIRLARFQHRLKPKLLLHCSPSVDGCVDRNAVSAIVFRVVVSSICDVDVEECKAVVRRILRGQRELFANAEFKLPFQPSEAPDCLCKTIHPGKSERLDIVSVGTLQSEGVAAELMVKNCPQWVDQRREIIHYTNQGEYLFHIEISAKGMRVISRELKFNFDGSSSTLEMLNKNPDMPKTAHAGFA